MPCIQQFTCRIAVLRCILYIFRNKALHLDSLFSSYRRCSLLTCRARKAGAQVCLRFGTSTGISCWCSRSKRFTCYGRPPHVLLCVTHRTTFRELHCFRYARVKQIDDLSQAYVLFATRGCLVLPHDVLGTPYYPTYTASTANATSRHRLFRGRAIMGRDATGLGIA